MAAGGHRAAVDAHQDGRRRRTVRGRPCAVALSSPSPRLGTSVSVSRVGVPLPPPPAQSCQPSSRRQVERVSSASPFPSPALRDRRYGNTMAESKGALIAKTVQKHAGRAKEKVSARHRLYLSSSLSRTLVLFIPSNRSLSSSTRARDDSDLVVKSGARTRERYGADHNLRDVSLARRDAANVGGG